jgi:hypothetical protein
VTNASTSTPEQTEPAALPLGTSAPFERMHRNIRRVCYVLLFGLVLEGALTFPLLAIWYGFPELSAIEVCSELQKVMYSDEERVCQVPYEEFPGPPIGSPSEAEGQDTAEDIWGVQPQPQYPPIEFRELVENHEQREAGAEDEGATDQPDDGGG